MAKAILNPSSPATSPDVSVSPRVEKSTDRCDSPGAENPVDIRLVTDKPTFATQNTKSTHGYHTFSLEFEAVNCVTGAANGAKLLSVFAHALTTKDKDASVLLKNSTSEDQQIDSTTTFPTDPHLLQAFVRKYLGAIRHTEKSSFKGKITVRSRCTLQQLQKSKEFRNFCEGKWNDIKPTPVILRSHELNVEYRCQTGFFLNTLTGSGMEQDLSERLVDWFSESGELLPPFQLEPFIMYRGKTKATLFRIMVAPKDDALMGRALTRLFPEPSTQLSFVLSKTWGQLKAHEKLAYFMLHVQYQKSHCPHLLYGIKDSSVAIEMNSDSTEKISILNWLKGADVFDLVEPALSSGRMPLVSTLAKRPQAQKFLATFFQKIVRRASVSSVDQIFLHPAAVRKKANSTNVGTKPPAHAGAKARASQAPGKTVEQNLRSFRNYNPSAELFSTPKTTKSTSKKKSPPRGSYGGAKSKDIIFHLSAPIQENISSSDESPPGKPSASDVDVNASPKRPKRRRQKKKKQQPAPGAPVTASSSPKPRAVVPADDPTCVSAVAEEVMDVGVDDDSTTNSVQSVRSYASVTAGTKSPPTEVNGATEIPSPVTVSVELRNSQSQNAALKRELAASKAESKALVAKLEAQLATLSRAPPGARSTAETESSKPSSVAAATPEVDTVGSDVHSPPPVARSTAETAIADFASLLASTPDEDLDGAAVTVPLLRIRYGTQARERTPPSRDDAPASKRFRLTVTIDPQLAPLPVSTEEEDADLMVNNAASQTVAGRPLPDEEVNLSATSKLETSKGGLLKQRKLFEYAIPKKGRSHDCGLTKSVSDFEHSPAHSTLWGDKLSASKRKVDGDVFRTYSHNPNGLSCSDDNLDVLNFARAIHDKDVALVSLYEVNRNFGRQDVLKSFHHHLRGVSTHHQGAVSSARLPWRTKYQPGGTAVSVRNKWATRYLDKGSDSLGRWSWLTLTGKGTTRVTFISAYRVCDGAAESSVTSGTVRSQQEYLYASWGHSSINLREQFVTDISALIIELQDKGHTIQLSMDANEASGPGSGVDRIMSNCNLVDAHSICTSDSSPVPATYQRGSKKIDFVLLSPRLVEAVVGVSILALYDGYLSDHRALIVDFDALLLFGGPTSSIIAPMERRLTSTNPRAIHAYTTHMRSHFATHRIVEKVAALSAKSAKDQWGPAEILEWEKIDDQLDKARRAAEQKCASKQSSKYPWSPELDRAGSGVLYWQLRMREFINPETNLDSLETLAVKANIPESSQTRQTSEFVQQALRQARRDLKQVQKDSVTLREQHAAETAKFYATVHNMDTAKAARAIASRELSSKRFRELRSVMKPGRSNGLDYLDVPNADAVLREGEEVPRIPLVTKEEMEEALLPHTEKRFRQYQETPFGADVRRKRLGLDCTSADVQALLNSSYDHDLDGLTVEAQTWLKQLQKKPFAAKPDGLISTVIEVDEWIAGWSKMRESTASAPGGHYGHYKTAAVIAKLDEKHEDYFPDLAETYAIMTSFPLKWGFAPKRWCSCIDAILEKIPGRPIIEKLRIIMLYEADFNFVLKLIWGKRLVRHAESNLALGSDNHGSRPGRKCTDALLEKLLIYENARLTRTSLITVDNDAKSCYDRIIKTLAMTACMAVGLPLAAAMMHNLTHHSMKHRIKSRHGLFRAYFGTDDDALEGTGQGSGGSPGIWLIYSVSLLAAFCNFSPGMKLLSPYDTLLMVSILAVFFVDDGMLGRNDATDEFPCPLPDLIVAAEESAQSWERLLFASGGALELSKCFAYIVYWDLSPSKEPRMLEPQEISGCTPEGDHFRGPIGLKYGDVSTVRHLIVTESPHRGRRTLGARIAPSGNWDDEFNFRRKQGHELSLRLAGSSLAKETARLGYRTMVCPALEYPLTVTQFTQERCDKISSPILRSSLSQMGYNRNSPKEVVYGPEEMGGLGLHDLFIEQGIAQVTALVGHLREKKSKTGDMMKIELDWCQLQAGTADHLLENPFTAIDYIESCWIMSIRDFLRMYKVRMEFTEHSHPVALCEGDEFIMDALRVRGQCSARDMQRLNACRMHLRVSRLSEIATAQGTKIRADVLKGNTEGIHLSEARWPRQAKPLAADWTFWSNKLRAVFSIDGGSPSLRTHLGPWKPTLDFREWNTLVSVDTVPREVFRRLPDGNYEVFEEAAGRNSTRSLWVSSTTSKVTDTLPFDVVPAEMQVTTKKVKQSKVLHRGQTFTPPSRAEATSFSEYVAQQPPHVQRLLRHCDLTEITTRKLVTLISSPRPFDGGTDGGLLNEFGTFGYVWGNSFAVDKLLPVGKGHVPGASFIMSSTRAELCGLFAAITHLRLVVEYHAIIPNKNASCRIYCDSKAALARVADKYYNGFGTTWRCRTNYDLEVAIRNCLLELPIPIKWHWVKGHASSRKRPDELTFPELLNETADELATAARQSQALMQLDDAHWPEQTVSVIGPRGRMCGRLASELRFCCTAPDLLSYWRARFQWSKAQVALVDLPGTKQALAKLSSDAKQRVQKLRCGWLPVNRRVSREDPDRLNGCSACLPRNMVEETVDHLFQCPCRSRRLAMQDRLAGMFKAFREWKTSTALIKALHSGAWAWIEGREIPDVEGLNLPNSPMGKLIHKAYVDQTSLGWNLLFRGFWAISWRQAQDYEFSQSPFHRGHQDNGVSWASRAQGWFFDLFDLVWGLRNADEHGGDLETQRLIRLAKCERAIRRLYRAGKLLPFHEQHQFRDEIEDVLSKSLSRQERWITLTEDFLPGAAQRVRDREQRGQNSLMAYDGWSRTPRIHE